MVVHGLSRLARDQSIEQSLDAAMEIEEVIAGRAKDAPSLKKLVQTLLGAPDNDGAQSRRHQFRNAQLVSLSQRAATASGRSFKSIEELHDMLSLLLRVSQIGLSAFEPEQLTFIRDFCLGLNRDFVAETYGRISRPAHDRTRQKGALSEALA